MEIIYELFELGVTLAFMFNARKFKGLHDAEFGYMSKSVLYYVSDAIRLI